MKNKVEGIKTPEERRLASEEIRKHMGWTEERMKEKEKELFDYVIEQGLINEEAMKTKKPLIDCPKCGKVKIKADIFLGMKIEKKEKGYDVKIIKEKIEPLEECPVCNPIEGMKKAAVVKEAIASVNLDKGPRRTFTMEEYKIGDSVSNEKYGKGIITKIIKEEAEVDFKDFNGGWTICIHLRNLEKIPERKPKTFKILDAELVDEELLTREL